jgi:hypothetical protein
MFKWCDHDLSSSVLTRGLWVNVSKQELGIWSFSFVMVCFVSWLKTIFALFYLMLPVVVSMLF